MVFLTIGNPYTSSIIRGQQIAERLGAELNPSKLYSDEIVIFVKTLDIELAKRLKSPYIDIVDSDSALEDISKISQLKVIVMTELAKQYIGARIENEVIVIPEHHCNYENVLRTRKEVKVLGYVGSTDCLHLNSVLLDAKLREIGMRFHCLFCDGRDLNREDICQFYKTIDVQLAFRPTNLSHKMPPELKNPLKLENAGSFGIPTIAYPELNYIIEFKEHFLSVLNYDDIIKNCLRLKESERFYDICSQEVLESSKIYHINEIIKLYKGLKK